MQRDVVTHEFFHLLGSADVKNINSTADALNDASTVYPGSRLYARP